MTAEERFWAKVDTSGDCWLWTGATKHSEPARAYGMLWMDGRNWPAAQIAWEFAHGKAFPEGMDACHHCDNPRCVRAEHIFPGTARDNAQDALRKGRLDVLGNGHKTSCKRGHPFTPENTYRYPDDSPNATYRGCRTCRQMLGRRRRAALAAPSTEPDA